MSTQSPPNTQSPRPRPPSASAEYIKPKCNRLGPKSRLFRTAVPFDAPDGVDPLKLSDPNLAQKNLESLGYNLVQATMLALAILIQYVNVTDTQTDTV